MRTLTGPTAMPGAEDLAYTALHAGGSHTSKPMTAGPWGGPGFPEAVAGQLREGPGEEGWVGWDAG